MTKSKRVYFILQLIIHHPGKLKQELKAGTETEAVGKRHSLVCPITGLPAHWSARSACFLYSPVLSAQDNFTHNGLGPLTTRNTSQANLAGHFLI